MKYQKDLYQQQNLHLLTDHFCGTLGSWSNYFWLARDNLDSIYTRYICLVKWGLQQCVIVTLDSAAACCMLFCSTSSSIFIVCRHQSLQCSAAARYWPMRGAERPILANEKPTCSLGDSSRSLSCSELHLKHLLIRHTGADSHYHTRPCNFNLIKLNFWIC